MMEGFQRQRFSVCAVTCALLQIGCSDVTPATRSERLIYGADDRIEPYEASDDVFRLVKQSSVALIPKTNLLSVNGTIEIVAETATDNHNLCPGERHGRQPSAAFCSGVLLDSNLVLVAGHCVRTLALKDFAVVFGYYYQESDVVSLTTADVAEPIEIVAEALDPAGTKPRLDFAWLRLAACAPPPREPARVYQTDPRLRARTQVVFASTGLGVPIKVDSGGIVRDPRADTLDYFVASTDSSHGSSGGGAFSRELILLGILSRGGEDLMDTAEGCRRNRVVSDGLAEEEFTYAFRAIEKLCETAPTGSRLCCEECGPTCSSLTGIEAQVGSAGCLIARAEPNRGCLPAAAVTFLMGLVFYRRMRRPLVKGNPVRREEAESS
jgi:hypothetical protein